MAQRKQPPTPFQALLSAIKKEWFAAGKEIIIVKAADFSPTDKIKALRHLKQAFPDQFTMGDITSLGKVMVDRLEIKPQNFLRELQNSPRPPEDLLFFFLLYKLKPIRDIEEKYRFIERLKHALLLLNPRFGAKDIALYLDHDSATCSLENFDRAVKILWLNQDLLETKVMSLHQTLFNTVKRIEIPETQTRLPSDPCRIVGFFKKPAPEFKLYELFNSPKII